MTTIKTKEKVNEQNLSSIVLTEINQGKRILRFKNTLYLTPTKDEEKDEQGNQLLIIEKPEINLHVFAYTRKDLIDEINQQLVMMWDEYVKAGLEELADDAQQLRSILLETIEEVN